MHHRRPRRIHQISVGAGFYPARAGRTIKNVHISAHSYLRRCKRIYNVVPPGGVEPLPYGNAGRFYGCALLHPNLPLRTAQSFRHGFAVPPPFAQGRLWCGQNVGQLKKCLKFPPSSAIILLRKSSQENRVAAMRKSGFFGLTLIFLQGDDFS